MKSTPLLTVWLESQDLDSLGTRHHYRIDCSEVTLFGHDCGEGELTISGVVFGPSTSKLSRMLGDGVLDAIPSDGPLFFRHQTGGPNSYAIVPFGAPNPLLDTYVLTGKE